MSQHFPFTHALIKFFFNKVFKLNPQLYEHFWNIVRTSGISTETIYLKYFICTCDLIYMFIFDYCYVKYVDNLVNQFLMTIVKVCLCFQFPNQSFTLLNLLNNIQKISWMRHFATIKPVSRGISSF